MGRKKGKKRSRQESTPAAQAASGAQPTWFEGKKTILRFVLVFAVIMAVFYAIWATPIVKDSWFPAYLAANASAGAAAIRIFGENAVATGQAISVERFSLEIARGCDGIQPTVLFLAAVAAFPAPRRAKLIGAISGSLVLLFLNLVRIVTLFYIGLHMPDLFHMMHVDVWQSFFILLAFLLWIIWALRVLPPPPTGGADDAAKAD